MISVKTVRAKAAWVAPLALVGGLALFSPTAEAAPTASYNYCPSGGSVWTDYTDRGRGHVSCSGYLVKVGVKCSNGATRWSGSDGANPEFRPNYNKVDCPRNTSVNSRVSMVIKD